MEGSKNTLPATLESQINKIIDSQRERSSFRLLLKNLSNVKKFDIILIFIFLIISTTCYILSGKNFTFVMVDIEGEVKNPGVYKLKHGSRVSDLLDASGGETKQANINYISQNINLAQILTDGQKIYIPSSTESYASEINAIDHSTISINNSSLDQITKLEGIGDITGQRIIAQRPYASVNELVSKKIIKTSLFEKIKNKIDL